jgi:hypothetical protein
MARTRLFITAPVGIPLLSRQSKVARRFFQQSVLCAPEDLFLKNKPRTASIFVLGESTTAGSLRQQRVFRAPQHPAGRRVSGPENKVINMGMAARQLPAMSISWTNLRAETGPLLVCGGTMNSTAPAVSWSRSAESSVVKAYLGSSA